MVSKHRVPEIPGGVEVLGITFQAFIDPSTNQAVFSQRGVSRGLKIARSTLAGILNSKEFKALHSKDFEWPTLLTTASSRPISVITQSDLSCLVKLLSDKKDAEGNIKYPVPKSMQDAGFPIILQQSVDHALGCQRSLGEYLEAGATLRQKLEYKISYHAMKNSTFRGGHGVKGLCRINKQVSTLAVPNAQERRFQDKGWRKKCSGEETVKITIGNTIHQKAVEASTKNTLDRNLGIASQRTSEIYELLDAPF